MEWRKPDTNKQIFLTFDDGPVPDQTEFVLTTLKSFNATGTFFCIGDNIRKNPEQFQKIIGAGHAVGNHTFNHMNGWRSSDEQYLDNIRLCEEQLASNGVKNNRLFRPPFGRIKRSQIPKLKDYRIIMWDVLTFDYDRSLNADTCLKGAIKATRPGSIVVFHDSVKADKNMKYVLPKFVEHFANEGFQFKPLV